MRALALVGCCLLLGLLILAPIVPQVSDAVPYPANSTFSDLTLTHWSAFEYARQQLAMTGQIPLWRTSILSGTPFAENPLAGLFYPPHWLAIFTSIPLALALNSLLWLHLALAAGAMYALLRRWQIRPLGAFASAIAFAAAPKIVAHMGLGHLTLVEAWAWVPMVLYPLTLREKTAPGEGACPVISGLALGVCVLADARMAVYAGALVVSYVIVMRTPLKSLRLNSQAGSGSRLQADLGHQPPISNRRASAWLPVIGQIAIVLIVAFAISAVAWLPTLSLTSTTSRAALAPEEAGVQSLDPIYLLGLLIADRSGAAERTTYVGLIVLVLAIIGAWRGRFTALRLRVWLSGVIIVGAIIALGTHTPLYNLLAQLPGASLLRAPARAWFIVVFASAALAGIGLHTILSAIKRPSLQNAVAVISLGLIVIDLMSVDWAVYRVTSVDEAFATGRDTADWLKQQPGEFRVYSPSLSIPQHVAQQFNLQLADGVDPLQLARYVQFMQPATGIGHWNYSVTLPPFPGIQSDADVGTALKNIVPNASLLGLFNVKYVVAAFPINSPDLIERYRTDNTIVYENQRVLPRAFMVEQIDVARSAEDAAQWLTTATLNEAAIIEGLPYPIKLDVPIGEVHSLEANADQLEFQANGPGLLVLSEVSAPDWTATLDGAPTTIFATDLALRGLFVPWGAHTIELVYQPRRIYAGVLISLLSLLACGIAIALTTFKQRQWRRLEHL